MDLKQAAINTRFRLAYNKEEFLIPYAEDEDKDCSYGLPHIAEMLDKLENKEITGEKGHRWLGYIQGVLVCRELMTLEEAKNCNKLA